METNNLPLLIGLEVTLLLSLVLGGGLWFSLRELRQARLKSVSLRREAARLKRRLAQKPASESAALSFEDYLQQALDQNQTYYQQQFEKEPAAELNSQLPGDELLLALRHKLLAKELELRKAHQGDLPLEQLTGQLEPIIQQIHSVTDTQTDSASEQQPSASATGNDQELESQLNHYKKLYDDLLVTLQRSKETIKSLALRLSDIIDSGMDEEQLNALLEDLNNSMEAFGELSGISSDSGASQLQDEVKEIRKTYEMGISLMEHFEQSLKFVETIKQSLKEHSELVDSNHTKLEEGETVDRSAVIASNKRYGRILDEEEKLLKSLEDELINAKEIIGSFLAMTRKYQDQSTRIVILQSREKQLNSDLRQMKQAQQEALLHLVARDIQLDALSKKYLHQDESEQVARLCELAQQIHEVEQEINQLNQQEQTSAVRKQKQQLVQKRLGLEILVRKEKGLPE
jgi:hypothetical protein